MTKMVPASEFKAKCLALINEMERSGEPLTITRRGKPSITLTAQRPAPERIGSIFGMLKNDKYRFDCDPSEPADPDWEAKWEAKWDERGFPVRDTKTKR